MGRSRRGHSRRNKNRRKQLRTKRKNKRQIVQRGGYYPEYGKDPDEVSDVVLNILKQGVRGNMVTNSFMPKPIKGDSRSSASGIFTPPLTEGNTESYILYLLGYDDFIKDHSLVPLYDHRMESLPSNAILGNSDISQVYYYLSPLVRKTFIYDCSYVFDGYQATDESSQYTFDKDGTAHPISIGTGDWSGVQPKHPYRGYQGMTPWTHKLIKPGVYREISSIDDKPKHFNDFLFFPQYGVKGHERDRHPTQRYITFDFIPDGSEREVKRVKGIGNVILQKPPNHEPWTGKTIRILFEPDFVPPPIDDIGFSPETFVQVGQALLDEGNEKTPGSI